MFGDALHVGVSAGNQKPILQIMFGGEVDQPFGGLRRQSPRPGKALAEIPPKSGQRMIVGNQHDGNALAAEATCHGQGAMCSTQDDGTGEFGISSFRHLMCERISLAVHRASNAALSPGTSRVLSAPAG